MTKENLVLNADLPFNEPLILDASNNNM